MRIVLLGMNHRSAPLELRERLAVDDPGPPLRKLVASDEIDEAVLFSTCNRVEVVAVTRCIDAARERLRNFFAKEINSEPPGFTADELDEHLYEHTDRDAMRHVLRVASSLDSMVVGEPQILGQMKDAYQRAAECGAAGPLLGRLFQHAFATAKRVRSETRIAERPVSVARVAVDLARKVFEDFADKQALLIGAGEMIEIALRSLRSDGLQAVRVANRTPERAAELAARFAASAHGLDEVPALLRDADMVLTSIAGDRPILTVECLSEALRARRNRPVFVVDIGVPRNADPAINELDNVYLYDIDDLDSVACENAEERRRETVSAEAIVEEQRECFDAWLSALRAVPMIKRLRERVEVIRAAEVERAFRRLQFGEEERDAVDALTRSIVNKVLHIPVSRMRREAERDEGVAYLEVARVLFGLDEDADSASGE